MRGFLEVLRALTFTFYVRLRWGKLGNFGRFNARRSMRSETQRTSNISPMSNRQMLKIEFIVNDFLYELVD